MINHEAWTARAYEAMRQQQAGSPTQAPAWANLTHGMRQAIIATAVHAGAWATVKAWSLDSGRVGSASRSAICAADGLSQRGRSVLLPALWPAKHDLSEIRVLASR